MIMMPPGSFKAVWANAGAIVLYMPYSPAARAVTASL